MSSLFSFIDLFAGIGGFRIALNNLGGTCINFSEINTDAITTYCSNYSESPAHNLGDIKKIKELPPHDLLTGGVPCQSWSIAGKNLGFDDDRGQLWNDTIFLLNQSKPKAFIFENVKGLVDPRNKEALQYILNRIKEAGYFANFYVLESSDYGVPQSRVRIYIIGFRDEQYYKKFRIPKPASSALRLKDYLDDFDHKSAKDSTENLFDRDLFGNIIAPKGNMSLSNNNGFNDYFLFNDLRNGHTTIHSWDILDTSKKQKEICLLLLKNRRKSAYGNLDGNPLSLKHFCELDDSISQCDLDELVELEILKEEKHRFCVKTSENSELTEDESLILSMSEGGVLIPDNFGSHRELKVKKVSITSVIESLEAKGILCCDEIRYDFRNTKISTGLFGVNRIFLPESSIFPTLVASDSNDFVSTVSISGANETEYRNEFLEKVFIPKKYRKINQTEACRIQGFPEDFELPQNRARWMKLIGNSVSVPVIEMIGKAILDTGVFK